VRRTWDGVVHALGGSTPASPRPYASILRGRVTSAPTRLGERAADAGNDPGSSASLRMNDCVRSRRAARLGASRRGTQRRNNATANGSPPTGPGEAVDPTPCERLVVGRILGTF